MNKMDNYKPSAIQLPSIQESFPSLLDALLTQLIPDYIRHPAHLPAPPDRPPSFEYGPDPNLFKHSSGYGNESPSNYGPIPLHPHPYFYQPRQFHSASSFPLSPPISASPTSPTNRSPSIPPNGKITPIIPHYNNHQVSLPGPAGAAINPTGPPLTFAYPPPPPPTYSQVGHNDSRNSQDYMPPNFPVDARQELANGLRINPNIDYNGAPTNGIPAPLPVSSDSISSTSPISPSSSHNKKKRRGNLPREVTDVLRSWLNDHIHHPYPSEIEKSKLMKMTGLTLNQISNWFINARRRRLPALQHRVVANLSPTSPTASAFVE